MKTGLKMPERRYRVYRLPCDFWELFFVTQDKDLPDVLAVPEIVIEHNGERIDVRECRVIAVQEDLFANSFLFQLYHPSFDVVSAGDVPPEFNASMTLRAVKIKKEKEQVCGRCNHLMALDARWCGACGAVVMVRKDPKDIPALTMPEPNKERCVQDGE